MDSLAELFAHQRKLSGQILIVLQRDPEMNDPTPDDLYRTGTIANIVRYVTSPEGGHHLICQGVQRFRITDFVEGYPFLLARGRVRSAAAVS